MLKSSTFQLFFIVEFVSCRLCKMLILFSVLTLLNCIMGEKHHVEDIKPGHDIVKEYHFHPYWHQNNVAEVGLIALIQSQS